MSSATASADARRGVDWQGLTAHMKSKSVSQVFMIAHVVVVVGGLGGGGLAVFVGKVLCLFAYVSTRHSIDKPADTIDYEMRNQDQLPSGILRPIRRGI